MRRRLTRRRFATLGGIALAGLAGCGVPEGEGENGGGGDGGDDGENGGDGDEQEGDGEDGGEGGEEEDHLGRPRRSAGR